MERPPKNIAERQLWDKMRADGWALTKQGWPDFACFKDDELLLIEVKPNEHHHLKRSQYQLLKALADRGIKCYYWAPDTGFQPITPTLRTKSCKE